METWRLKSQQSVIENVNHPDMIPHSRRVSPIRLSTNFRCLLKAGCQKCQVSNSDDWWLYRHMAD